MPVQSKSTSARRKAALRTACLSAGLVTAFIPATAHADASTTLVATNGTQTTTIYDSYVLNSSVLETDVASPFSALDVPSSDINDPSSEYLTADVTPVTTSNAVGPTTPETMVVFADSADMISGQSFDDEFLTNEYGLGEVTGTNAGTYDESQVINYISDESVGINDEGTADEAAYDEFIDNLYYGDYNTDFNNGAIPSSLSAYEFTNGQYIGTIDPNSLPAGSAPYTGFGLTPTNAVPEPGPLPLLFVGGAVLAGGLSARRRRTR